MKIGECRLRVTSVSLVVLSITDAVLHIITTAPTAERRWMVNKMPENNKRLTLRDGDGQPDLKACFKCDLMGKDGSLQECGGCEAFQAAIDKLLYYEEMYG